METMREKRKRVGLRVDEVAWLIGMVSPNLSRIETHEDEGYKRMPTLPQILAMEAVALLTEKGLLDEYARRVDEIRQVETPLVRQPRAISKRLCNGG